MADATQVLMTGPGLRLVVDEESAVPAAARPVGGSLRDLRLTRRGWWVLSLVAVTLVALVCMAVADRAFASQSRDAMAVTEHYVAQGETLWNIARGVALPGEDTRDVVEMLVELNGRSSVSLQVGERVLLPVR